MIALQPMEAQYLAQDPGMIPVYGELKQAVEGLVGDFDVNVKKTQIAFRVHHNFLVVSFPMRKIKGWPDHCLVLSFFLPRFIDHPRVVQHALIRPGHYTHHVLIERSEDIDDTLLAWIQEAYDFAERPRGRAVPASNSDEV